MSLLHQDSAEEIDDAARGESYTRGTSHVVVAGIVATLVVAIVVTVLVVTGEKPPVASGEIVQVWAHPSRVETSGFDANGEAMAKESYSQVLLFAHVKVRNQSKFPIFLEDVLANVQLPDGGLSVSQGDVAQYQQAMLAYPELSAARGNPLSPRTMLSPGQGLDGIVFWVFRANKQQWDARTDWKPDSSRRDPGSRFGLNFTFSFQYQPSVVLAPHTPVIEQ
ncbi:MAG: hypothetical protein ABSE55_09680 [Terracidiphilus sp.]|jgi:hypothetical protein